MPNKGDFQSLWGSRINAANKLYKKWSNRYKCDKLEAYYKNDQWRGKRDSLLFNYNPYTLNLFYSTIKIKSAANLYQRPSFTIEPRPGNFNDNLDFAFQSAKLKQDVLNTVIQNPNANFAKAIKRAFLDSFFRFGVIESGYAADWRNPLKPEPLTKSWLDPNIPDEKDRVIDDNLLPVNERGYVKRIKPNRFRVSVSDAEDLDDHDWVGYIEYYYTRTLKNTKGIDWEDQDQDSTLSFAAEYSSFIGDNKFGSDVTRDDYKILLESGEITPVWRIWSNVDKKQFLLRDGDFFKMWSDPFTDLPLQDLRWDEELSGFYPIPPSFQWLSPQDEINEAREQVRSYRRRFTRKFQAVAGAVSPEEKEKFASGPDGVIIEVGRENAITAIDNPEMGQTAENALIQATNDFYTITGTTPDARDQQGGGNRTTATQAKIFDTRAQVRESAEALDFANFVSLIGRKLLTQLQMHAVDGFWVKDTMDPGENTMQDMTGKGPVFKWIAAQDLRDGYDYQIDVDVMNDTPAAQAQAQQSFVSFLSIVQQFPAIAMSPKMIRMAALVCGFRNEDIIAQYQQVAIKSMAMKEEMANAASGQQPAVANGGVNPNNAAVAQTSQMATPSIDTTQQQIANQI